MDLHILSILAFFSIILVVSQASLPPEIYWKKMFPNAEMPKAIKLSLSKQEDLHEEKGEVHLHTNDRALRRVRYHQKHHKDGNTVSKKKPTTYVGVGPGFPNPFDYRYGPHPPSRNSNNYPSSNSKEQQGATGSADSKKKPAVYVGVNPFQPNPYDYRYGHGPPSKSSNNYLSSSSKEQQGATGSKDPKKKPDVYVGVNPFQPNPYDYRYGHGPPSKSSNNYSSSISKEQQGATGSTDPKKKPAVYVGVNPFQPNPYDYRYGHGPPSKSSNNYSSSSSEERQTQPEQQGRSLFFLEKEMKFGNSMKVHFTQPTNAATFLPREKANTLPFSTNKILEILQEFAVEPNTAEAKVIEETIQGCQDKGIEGEQRYCATSLESMVDYAKNTLGNNVKAMSTEANIKDNKVQNYIIAAMKKVAGANEAMVCHKQRYAYAVFYCHKSTGTSVYKMSLINKNGSSKAKAMAICHKDTSAWNPQHMAFRILNVKPGTVPVCHFLPEDHIVWISN